MTDGLPYVVTREEGTRFGVVVRGVLVARLKYKANAIAFANAMSAMRVVDVLIHGKLFHRNGYPVPDLVIDADVPGLAKRKQKQ